MPILFLDCTTDMVPLWQQVLRPGDPPIRVNIADGQPGDVPALLEGHDICIDDHTLFNAALLEPGPRAQVTSRLTSGIDCFSRLDPV